MQGCHDPASGAPLSNEKGGRENGMNGKRALFALLFFVLVADVFWNGALRTIALRFPDSPWAHGLIYNK